MIRAVRDKAMSAIAGAMVSEYLQSSSRGENGSSDPLDEPTQAAAVQNDSMAGDFAPSAKGAAFLAKYELKIEQLEHRCKRFFDVIRSIQDEREQWKRMFYDEGAAHLKAQYLYEQSLAMERQMLAHAVTLINQYRKKEGEPEMAKPPREWTAPPFGKVAEFEALLRKLQNDSPTPFDYVQQAIATKEEWEIEDNVKAGKILDPNWRPISPTEQWRSTT